MKKSIFVILISGILAAFALLGCNKSGAVKLDAPNNFRMENEIIFWDEVEHADLYIVTFFGEETETAKTQFELPNDLQVGKYKIEVMAISNENYFDSDIAVYNFKIEKKEEEKIMNYDAPLSYKLIEDRSGYEVHRMNTDPNEGLEGVVVIPDFYKGLPVKRIANNAFHLGVLGAFIPNTVTTGFVLPQYLESIGEYAFAECEKIEEIDIPESVRTIEHGAFLRCSNLKKVKLPQMLRTISESMLSFSGIEEIELPPIIESLDENAFYHCESLKAIDIPDTVTKIGAYAFMGCISLKEVKFPSKLENLENSTFSNTAWYDAQPNGYIIINDDFLYGYKGETPESLELPQNIQYIAGDAFGYCKTLKSITFGSNIRRICRINAFYHCDSLETVNYTGDIVDWCNIEFLDEASNPLSNGAKLYIGGQLVTDLVIPNDVTEIKDNAFCGYEFLQSAIIGENVRLIGEYAFRECVNLRNITVPSSVIGIKKTAFVDCYRLVEINNHSSIDIPVGYNMLGMEAYSVKHIYDSNKGEKSNIDYRSDGYIFIEGDDGKFYLIDYVGNETELILPDDYNGHPYEIYQYAFADHKELTSVTIGEEVYVISASAFKNCSGLMSVTFKITVGWQYSSYNYSKGEYVYKEITATDPVENAKNLIKGNYDWERKIE